MNIEWQTSRNANHITINKRGIALISVGVTRIIKCEDDSRVLLGFSEDRKTMEIKKSPNGLKLSVINNRSHGRTFSAIGLLKQFGEEIKGTYELKEYDKSEDVAILKRVE
jgi:hypothetical protein